MSQRELNAAPRIDTGKEAAKRLRRAGSVPGVVYGHKEEPALVSLNAKHLRDTVHHGGTTGLFSLKVEGGNSVPVIIKKTQKHPVTHSVLSIDFLRVALDEKVRSTVPVVLTGEPVGVRVDGGVLVQAIHILEIESLPQDVPESIVVDVSHLEFDGAPVYVREVALPAGVVVLTDPDDDIAVVAIPDTAPPAEEEAAA